MWLTPLLAALLGFDGIAGELQHRAIRFWTVRARRGSIYVGKVLGLAAVVAAVTLGMDVLVWAVFVLKEGTPGEILRTGSLLYLASIPILFVWAAIAALVSSLFRTPTIALLVTFAVFFALWVVYAAGLATQTKALLYVYPNFYEDWMLSREPKLVAGGVAILLGLGALVTGAGAIGFARRDV